MKKVKVTLKSGEVKEYQTGDMVVISTASRWSGMVIFILGLLLFSLNGVNLILSNYVRWTVVAAVFFIWIGWRMWQLCPVKDNLTLKEGLFTYVGKVDAKDLLNTFMNVRSAALLNMFLCDEQGKKICKFSNVEEREV